MKANREYLKVIAFLLGFAILIPLGSSFFQTILANLIYATMNEKDASKDVLVYKENDFYKFDISEYDELNILVKNILYPCYAELNNSLDKINSSIDDKNELEASIQFFYMVVDKWQSSISHESIEQNGRIKELLNNINNDFLDIKNASNRVLNSHADSEVQIANQQLLVSRIKDFYFNYCYLLLNLIYGIKDNRNIIDLFNHVIESVNNLDNDPLIDLETPYFSLPKEYAENKEKQIFSYIQRGKRDARSVMALILLYIKMKNITDAELLYSQKIAPLRLANNQDIELSRTIALMINEMRNNNPMGILDKTTIKIDTNMNVQIIERYFIRRPENEKDVFIFLPYNIDDIVLYSLTDKENNKLDLKKIETSWKNSCFLQFACDEDLTEFNLEYLVKDFFSYSDKYGTYSYRYGGINQNVNYTCEIIMPSFFKATAFLEYPVVINNDKSDDEQYIMWSNPAIPFKISALDFSYYKNGIAGEIIPLRLLYNKYVYLIFVLFMFIVLYSIISNALNNVIIYECSFLVISSLTLFLLFWDVHFVDIVQIITRPLPYVALRILLAILIVITLFLFYKIEFVKGNKYFKIISSIILLSICAYGLNLFLQNSDKTSIYNKIYFPLAGVYYSYVVITHLSKQLELSKTQVLMMFISIIIICFSLSYVFKELYISKEILNLLGLFTGLVFTFIIGLCLIIEHKTVRNANDQTNLELFIDDLSIKFQGKALPIAHMLLLFMIPISLISEYSFLLIIFQLFSTIFGPQIAGAFNSGRIFGKKTSATKSYSKGNEK